MLSLNKTSEALGVSRRSLQTWVKEPGYPKDGGLEDIAAWIQEHHPKAAARMRNLSGAGVDPAAARRQTLGEKKLEADIAIKHQQLAQERINIIDDFWEEIVEQLRFIMDPLKKELAKCKLSVTQSKRVNKALTVCQQRLEQRSTTPDQ